MSLEKEGPDHKGFPGRAKTRDGGEMLEDGEVGVVRRVFPKADFWLRVEDGPGTRTEQEGGNGGQRHGEGAESTLLSSANGAASGEGWKHAGSQVSTGHPA